MLSELRDKRPFEWRYNLGKSHRKRVHIMPENPLFFAWLAGFIDGEGCFKIAVKKNPVTGIGFEAMPCIDICQGIARKSKMETLATKLGQSGLTERHSRMGGNMFSININRVEDVKALINAVYPYLYIKKDEAEVFIEILKAITCGKHLTVDGFLEIVRLREKLSPLRTKPKTYRNYLWFQNYFKNKEVA